MLEWAKHHLYARASDEWGYDALDADPLVHLLVGACASEAKEVYQAIQSTEDRVFERLLRYLLPAAYHLPQPAVAIAGGKAKTGKLVLPDTHHLLYKTEDKAFAFTPVFEATLLAGDIRYIGIDEEIIDRSDKQREGQFLGPSKHQQTVSRLLVGIETIQALGSLENTTFYLDWKGSELEKRQVLQSFSQSTWHWNELDLQKQNGFIGHQDASWQESIDPERQLQSRVHAQYYRNFLTITDTAKSVAPNVSVKDMLDTWMSNYVVSPENNDSTIDKWSAVKGNFTWVRVQLPYPITLTDIKQNLVLEINHFPVANRRLVEKDDSETFFSRSLGLELIQIKPSNGLFLGIKQVLNQKTNKPLPSKAMAQLLKEKNQPSFVMRMNGIGRADDFNTWQRLQHMLGLFRQEHRQSEVAERLGDNLSLEELHEIIGQRILKSTGESPIKNYSPSVFLMIQPGDQAQQLRVKVAYWQTDGEGAGILNANMKLLSEIALSGLDQHSLRLVTAPKGAKDEITSTEQGHILQDQLFRRGRVVTAQDIKSLCFLKMGDKAKNVHIQPYFETDRSSMNGGFQRAFEVQVSIDDPDDTHAKLVAQEIELTLMENSVGTIPYRVRLVK
jgi:hypothetical protein